MNPEFGCRYMFFEDFMAEELKTVEPTTAVGQEPAPKATTPETIDESISLDTTLTPEPNQSLAAFSLSGISGISVDNRRQAGQGSVLSFVMGKEIPQGVEGRNELLQREFVVSEVMRGMETSLKNPTLSPGLQKALSENPDFLFPFSPLKDLEVIKIRTGKSIVPEHPDLQEVRRLAEGYIPKLLPGNFPKHQLRSLGDVRDGDVASSIAEDVQSVRGLATSQGGPQGIVREDIAERWKVLQTAARAAA